MSELDKAIQELESELIEEGVAADAPKKGAVKAEPMSKGADYEDLGSAVTSPTDTNSPGKKAAGKVKKDSSASSKVALKAEAKKVEEEEDEMEDEEEDDEKDVKESAKKSKSKMSEEDDEMEDEDDEDEDDDEEVEESFEDRLAQLDVSEDVSSLIDGEDLSEEFKNKTHTIFEAAVKSKLRAEVERIEEEAAVAVSEEVESIKEELTDKIDSYLSYAISEWMEENKLAIERGLKSELAEEFISGLKGLFEEHYIDVPNEKYDVMEEQAEKIDELEAKLNEAYQKNIELNENVNTLTRKDIISEASEGLTDIQQEKFYSLAEEIEYEDEESFIGKLNTIKESYFHKTVKQLESFDSNIKESVEVDGSMSKYMSAISKTKTGK